jgi:hypothetical protein
MQPKWKDPVVEEIRAIRDTYAKQFDYDIEAICRDLKAQEIQSERETISLPPERCNLEQQDTSVLEDRSTP